MGDNDNHLFITILEFINCEVNICCFATGDQFARLKNGDRYFYDLAGHPGELGPLEQACRALALENFKAVQAMPAFINLRAEKLRSLLEHDNLRADEPLVFDGSMGASEVVLSAAAGPRSVASRRGAVVGRAPCRGGPAWLAAPHRRC